MNISNDKKSFYQWETNRFLVDEDFKINQEVCFSSVKLRKALVVKTKLKNNKIVVEVPNLLLQDYHPIMVHWVIADENGKYVTKEQEFQVLKRAKPEDYVYTETEIFSFLDLEQRLKNLEEEGINKAIADYFVKNPIQSGATSEQVAQIIQNKENIEKLNKNKLDADKLPEAINNALTQAEASGAFKGEPGKDGVVPVTGAAVGQTIKITAVDENGNPTEWEATDFPESSTQPDWNQNDESAADYVKNRPFYEVPDVVIFDDNITLSYGIQGRDCTYVFSNKLPLEAGKTYSLTYDCSSVSTTIEFIPDNYLFAFLNLGNSPSYSFMQGSISSTSFVVDYPVSNSGRLTIKKLGSDIKQLDPKYIKDMYYTGTETYTIMENYPLTDVGDDWVYQGEVSIGFEPGDIVTLTIVNDNGDNMSESTVAFKKDEVNMVVYSDNVNLQYEPDTKMLNVYYKTLGMATITVAREVVHTIDPKYIKDMYHEEAVELFSVENAEFVNSGYMLETPFAIVDGHTYIVNWDGVEYTCEAYPFNGFSIIGNTAEFSGKGNGEPFNIGYFKNENATIVGSIDGLTTHTFSVTEIVRHTIDPKYIKDMYYDNGIIVTELVPSQTVSGFAVMNDPIYGSENPFELTLVKGTTYIVNWDGTEYKLVAETLQGTPVIYVGNPYYMDKISPSNDMPFVIGYVTVNDATVIMTESTAESHVISITEAFHDIKQIDEKYLPIMEKTLETVFETDSADDNNFVEDNTYKMLSGQYVITVDGTSEAVEFIVVEVEGYSYAQGNLCYIETVDGGIYFNFPDDATHSVKIEKVKDVIKEEYLPDVGYATEEYVDECVAAVREEIDFIQVNYISDLPNVIGSYSMMLVTSDTSLDDVQWNGTLLIMRRFMAYGIWNFTAIDSVGAFYNGSVNLRNNTVSLYFVDSLANKADKKSIDKDYIALTDIENGYEYIIHMKNGNLISVCKIVSIEVTTMPIQTEYIDGEPFNPAGIVITATCQDGTTRIIDSNTITYNSVVTLDNCSAFEIQYVDAGIKYTTTIVLTCINAGSSLSDFKYTIEEEGTYTLTGWKDTKNGVFSTECIIPDSNKINL